MQWFAMRLNQHNEHTSACAGGFLGEKQDRQRVGGSITMQTAIRGKEAERHKGQLKQERTCVKGIIAIFTTIS
jgi:hypothetical protein